jgi:hypothetical protein
MFWRGLLICIVIAAGCETVRADDLGIALGAGLFSKPQHGEGRPLYAFSAAYTHWTASDNWVYPELIAGYWNAEVPVHHVTYSSDAATLDDFYGHDNNTLKYAGVYSGIRIVFDDERRTRRENLTVWPAIGIGGIAQWTNPKSDDGLPRYRALGFLRINILIERNAIMFFELEGQSGFGSHGGPGIAGVLKLGHRFRAF